ncbi:MAG: hypothetical protein RSA71_03405 [Eubacterium sp.]
MNEKKQKQVLEELGSLVKKYGWKRTPNPEDQDSAKKALKDFLAKMYDLKPQKHDSRMKGDGITDSTDGLWFLLKVHQELLELNYRNACHELGSLMRRIDLCEARYYYSVLQLLQNHFGGIENESI